MFYPKTELLKEFLVPFQIRKVGQLRHTHGPSLRFHFIFSPSIKTLDYEYGNQKFIKVNPNKP